MSQESGTLPLCDLWQVTESFWPFKIKSQPMIGLKWAWKTPSGSVIPWFTHSGILNLCNKYGCNKIPWTKLRHGWVSGVFFPHCKRFSYLTCEHTHKMLPQQFMILLDFRLKYEVGKSCPERNWPILACEERKLLSTSESQKVFCWPVRLPENARAELRLDLPGKK